MDQPSGSGSKGGFDMSKLSMASKLLLGGGILLFIDIFLPWQGGCVDAGPLVKYCVNIKATSGDGGLFGVLMLVAVLALIAWEVMGALGSTIDVGGMSTAKVSGIIGAVVAALGLLKFLFSALNHGAWGAWLGLVLILAIAYGTFLKLKESGVMPGGSAPAPPPAGGGDSPIA